MSLHCPATLILARPGEVQSARELGMGLRSARIAAVFAGSAGPAGPSAAMVADALGMDVATLPGLPAAAGGHPGDRTPGGDDADLAEAIRAIADLYRGESVLLVASPQALDAALSALEVTGQLDIPAQDGSLVCGVLEVGDDGIRLGPRTPMSGLARGWLG